MVVPAMALMLDQCKKNPFYSNALYLALMVLLKLTSSQNFAN